MDASTIAQDVSSPTQRRGVRSTVPDEDLSRLGVAFAHLDAALLAGDTSDTLYDRWRTVIQNALPIHARAARGRRVKAKMLLAIIRETRAEGTVCELARSVANDLTGRVGRKKSRRHRPRSRSDLLSSRAYRAAQRACWRHAAVGTRTKFFVLTWTMVVLIQTAAG
jgi:hypothetical protein